MAKKKTTAADKKKRKKWIPILSTKEFHNMEIGETYIEDPATAIGKVVTINLMVLTRDPKKQSKNV